MKSLFLSLALIALPCLAGNDSPQAKDMAYRFGVAEAQNDRRTMEDRYVVRPENGFFAVYDGHGGHRVADYVKQHLHGALLRHPTLDKDPSQALIETFKSIHDDLDTLGKNSTGIPVAYKEGTTATVALIKNGTLHIAWVGDSRAAYSYYQSGRCAQQATIDHTSKVRSELTRCLDSGALYDDGYIKHGFHLLAVTRALGDKKMNEVGVIPVPEVQEHTLRPTDEFLILASDGIWDWLSSDSALQIVRHTIQAKGTYEEAAQALIAVAVERATEHQEYVCYFEIDNMTAIVVSLNGLTCKPTDDLDDSDGETEEPLSTDSSDSQQEPLIVGAQQAKTWFQSAHTTCRWLTTLPHIAAQQVLNSMLAYGV